MIKVISHNIPEIEQINDPTARRYRTPEGKLYPSATTVLSILDKSYLNEWRDAVGHHEADIITARAGQKGTKVHQACENFILGKPTAYGMFEQDAKKSFQMLQPTFAKIQEVHAMETRLWSDKLEVAGTVDLIPMVDGKLQIWDWKTSRAYKSREDIPHYFMQMAFYALAWWERTGILIPNLVVQMACMEYGLITYEEKTKDWLPKFAEVRKEFKRIRGF